MQRTSERAFRYALAVLAALVALFLRALLNPLIGPENPYHTAWLAVVFSAWLCGPGPAMATVTIGVLGVWYWFLPPFNSFAGKDRRDVFGLLGFLALSAVIIFLGESTRRLIARLRSTEKELKGIQNQLEQKIAERTASLAERTSSLEQRTTELAEKAAMLGLANDAIFVRDSSDKISYWNQGAQRLYGWSVDEAVGRDVHDLLHTEFPIPMTEIKQRESWEGELRHTKRDGQRILVASHWTTLRDASGEAKGWFEINTDITSRKLAEEATRRLSGRILTLQDEERRRIARELHDSLGQYLVALKINLDILSASDGVPAHVVAESSNILEQCITETRTISHLLHPPLLDESGLNSAVRWYVEGFSRRSGIPVRFENSADLPRVNSDLEIALFRAIQESLTNIHRHSGASSGEISLRREGEEVCLEIRDNGRGMKADQLARIMQGFSDVGVGLAGMRERVRQLGGSVEIKSNAGGTVVRVTAPLRESAADSSGSRPNAPDWRIA